MRVIVLGATGLLGHAIVCELRAGGHAVTAVSRSGPHAPQPVLDGCYDVRADVHALDDDELRARLEGHDALVYALGPDDRSDAEPPAAAFYERHLVTAARRVFALAADSGVHAAALLGSYFTAWERHRPGFCARHPYAAARLRQADACVAVGGERMRVTVLEIPYVFGTAPGVPAQWRELLYERVRRAPVVFWPSGGTSACTEHTVARVAVAALERGEHGARYPVGDIDLEWNELLAIALAELGRTPPILAAPRPFAELAARRFAREVARRGGELGVDPRFAMRDLMYARLFTDHAGTRARLGVPRDDVLDGIRRSVRDAYPSARRRR